MSKSEQCEWWSHETFAVLGNVNIRWKEMSPGKNRVVQMHVYKKVISEKHIVNNIPYLLMHFGLRTGIFKNTHE